MDSGRTRGGKDNLAVTPYVELFVIRVLFQVLSHVQYPSSNPCVPIQTSQRTKEPTEKKTNLETSKLCYRQTIVQTCPLPYELTYKLAY